MLKAVLLWGLAALFLCNSLLISFRSNFNAGTLLMWGATVILVAYALFYKQVDAFCAEGIGRVVRAVVLCGLGVFGALFVFVAVSGYSDRVQGDERAIIVLGAGVRGEEVGDMLRRRLEAALAAWQQNPGAYLVVTGGQGPQEDIPEALAMQRWLLARGVPQNRILLEDRSVSTEENLAFAKTLLDEAGVAPDAPVAVVSNAFHCYRASRYAERTGFAEVRTVPASINITALLPSYMREVLALLYMWLVRRCF